MHRLSFIIFSDVTIDSITALLKNFKHPWARLSSIAENMQNSLCRFSGEARRRVCTAGRLTATAARAAQSREGGVEELAYFAASSNISTAPRDNPAVKNQRFLTAPFAQGSQGARQKYSIRKLFAAQNPDATHASTVRGGEARRRVCGG